MARLNSLLRRTGLRKIVVALTKGGVGKTTTAVNLSAGLAASGFHTLLIDTDTQGQISTALGVQPEKGLADVLSDEMSVEEAVTSVRQNLWLLAGGVSLAGSKRMIARKDFGGEQVLSQQLEPLEGKFDFVVIDTAPGWDSLSINVLFYGQELLTPVSLEVLTLQGLLDFSNRISEVQEYHAGLKQKYVLPTFMDRRVKKSNEILEQLKNHFEPNQICHPIRYSVKISEAPGYGQSIYEYAPRSNGALDYKQLIRKVVAT
jgi:chromosome partitioning protein